MPSGKYCGSKEINSLGPKASIETNISKSSCFHDDKCFWPILPSNIECDKRQGTICNGPECI